jgi:hypothetical protein
MANGHGGARANSGGPRANSGGARAGAGAKPRTVHEASGAAYVQYQKARAKKETHNAKLAEFEELTKSGELVATAQIRKQADNAARVVRDSFTALPDRVASLLVGRAERDILIELRSEINATLNSIADDLKI